MKVRIMVRGGGDLASGVVVRLHRAGWQVIVSELAQPMAVRRSVSFGQAVYDGVIQVEEVQGRLVHSIEEAEEAFCKGGVPVIVDPEASLCAAFRPHVLVDARMRKHPPEIGLQPTMLVIGLGPGFTAGKDCHAVIETNRGPHLGRVIWNGPAQADTGIPERVSGFRTERVLRAPVDGVIEPLEEIGAKVKQGQVVARVSGEPVVAPFAGVLRGLVQGGLFVQQGLKIGDLDPRNDPSICFHVSDKALAIGGAVLEAILSWRPLRGWL